VYYTLGLKDLFDRTSSVQNEKCAGRPGQRSGLIARFSETRLNEIPPSKSVEVILTIRDGDSMCSTLHDVGIQILATCEVPTPFSQVYQYGWSIDPTTDELKVFYDQISRGLHHSANFSVSWLPSTSSRFLNADPTQVSSGGATYLDSILDEACEQRRLSAAAECDKKVSNAVNSHHDLFEGEYRQLKEQMGAASTSVEAQTFQASTHNNFVKCIILVCLVVASLCSFFSFLEVKNDDHSAL
jgi:hypothetical protein